MRLKIIYNLLKSLPRAHKLRRPCSVAYEFDADTGRLRIGAQELTLRPKTAALFSAIAAEPDHIFSKTELLDRFWPDLHVQDQAVFQCINEIRQAFGSKTCIRTYARMGYQWVGPTAARATNRTRLPWKRNAAIMASASVLLFAGALSSDSAPASKVKPVRIAVLPAQVESSAPKDQGLSLAIMEMITRQSNSLEGVEVVPDRNVLRLSQSGSVRDGAHLRRALKADISVLVSISRREETLAAQFSIEGRDGAVLGTYESASPRWLAQQIFYEVNNALNYSMAQTRQSVPRIVHHQNLIAAKRFMHMQEPAAARRILKNILAEDPAFLSAHYFRMLVDMDLGASMPEGEIERLREASHANGDTINETRALLLSARRASQNDDPLASSYIEQGRALAASFGLYFLGAAFEYQHGAALAADGAFDHAATAFRRALIHYRLADCDVGLAATYERLEKNYRAAGNEMAARAASAKLRALKELTPRTSASVTGAL